MNLSESPPPTASPPSLPIRACPWSGCDGKLLLPVSDPERARCNACGRTGKRQPKYPLAAQPGRPFSASIRWSIWRESQQA